MKAGVFLNSSGFEGLSAHTEILASAVCYAEAAERLGYDAVWVAEHHFIEFGVCPSALAMAAFLLGRTRRLRVGTAVTLAPLYHPLQLAEQAALLDQLGEGRFDFGIGRGGYLAEIEAFGVPADRWEREVEATLSVLLSAWTEAEAVSADPLFPFGPVRLSPRPRTTPRPPLFVGSASPDTIDRAAREGLPLLLYWGSDDDSRVKTLDAYAEAAARHGRDPMAVEHVIGVLAHVEDDEDAARERVGRNLTWSFMAGDKPSVSPRTTARHEGDRTELALKLTETSAVGPPALCIERLARTVERTAARRLSIFVEAAGERARVLENIERLAAEVLPALADTVGSVKAAPETP